MRPLPTLLNAATKAVVGVHPLLYRLTNLALHLLAVWLAMGVLLRLGFEARAAVLGAAIFALHPMQTEAVAFVSGRTDLLAAVFALAAVRLHLDGRAGLALLCVGFGLLSKEVVFAVPIALAVLDRRPRWVWPVYVALCLAVLLPKDPVARLYFEDVLTGSLSLVALYTRFIVAPVGQRVVYDHFTLDLAHAVIGGMVVVFAAAVALQRRAPRLAWGTLWIGLTLAPVLHLVPIPTLAAERYLYLPLFGVAAIVAWLLDSTQRTETSEKRSVIAVGLLSLALVGCAGATAVRGLDWTDEVSLWSAEARQPEAGYKAWQNLAVALAEGGLHRDAAMAINAASVAAPRHPVVFRNLVRMTARIAPLPRGFAPEALARPLDQREIGRWEMRLREVGHNGLADAVARISVDP